MNAVLKACCFLLAAGVTSVLSDRTLDRPGCSDVAFVREDKYLSCPYIPCNSTSCQDYNATSCQDYNPSSAVDLGGVVVWEWTESSNRKFLSSDGTGENIAGAVSNLTGDLHLVDVTSSMRVPNEPYGIFNCSLQNAEGHQCGYGSLRVLIINRERALSEPPTTNKRNFIPDPPVIGEKLHICQQGTTAGTNGINYFVLQGRRVDAVDFTEIFNLGNDNGFNITDPICTTCGCIEDYRNNFEVNEVMTRNLLETGYAAFMVTFFVTENTDRFNSRGRVCYGLRNRYVMVLEIAEVLSEGVEPIGVDVTITPAPLTTPTRPMNYQVKPIYFQPDVEVTFEPFPSPPIYDLIPESNTVIVCNATVAGNSSALLRWEGGGRRDNSKNFELPQISFLESAVSVENLTEGFLHSLCLKRGPGVFHMPLESMLGPRNRNSAYIRRLHAALVVCNASHTFHGAYTCFGVNTSSPFHAIVTISGPSPNLLPYVGAIVAGIVVITIITIVVIVRFSVKRYHSKRFGPLLMVSYRNLPPTRLSCTNFTFDLPREETTGQRDQENSSMEFARENLQFIKVLGEGQFGQVWKAKAEGICPDNVNLSIVAVKMLKPNASQWDRQEMHSELELMQEMPPHLNIVNFLGMCSETDSEPLLILMEFAVHGSLKDYLKRLTHDRNNPARLERIKRLGQHSQAAASRPCLCPCHSAYNVGGEGGRERSAVVVAGQQQGIVGQTSGQQQGIVRATVGHQVVQTGQQQRLGLPSGQAGRRPSNVGSMSYQYDPAAVAHAARLMRLLDSEYHQHENGTGQNGGSDSHSLAESEDLCECAYHLQVGGNYYNYQDHIDYYNHAHYTGGGGARGVVNIEEDGEAREKFETPPPSYENAIEERSCQCSLEDTCQCSSSSMEEGEENLYQNVPTGCIYCSEGVEEEGGEEGGEGTVCMCPELNVAEGKLSYFELLDFAHQIARGMEHLEKMKCVHRDLAARNVLIAEGFWLKIGDFGLSRTLAWKDYYRKVTPGKIPARWMAKESLEERFHTSKSDVWSYGVVLWEVMTYGELPYGRTPMASSIDTLAAYLSTGRRLPQPVACSSQMYQLLLKCWDENPDKRPSFTQLADIFTTLLQKSPDHLNTSIEVAAAYPEVAALEAEVFLRMCPVFEPPENFDNCPEFYPLDSPRPRRGVAGPLLNGVERKDSGLELGEQDGRHSVSPGVYVPPNEVKIPQHKILRAVESGVSSDGSYLGLHDPTSDIPLPPGPLSPVSGTSRSEATPTYNAKSAGSNLKTGLSQNLTRPLTDNHGTSQDSPMITAARTTSPESQPTTAPQTRAGRSHDLSRGSRDQDIVITETRKLWRNTDSIETTV